MRSLLVALVVAFLALCASAAVSKQPVMVTYPQDTPQSVINDAMKAIENNGGTVTHEFKLIKGFAAVAPEPALDAVKAVGEQYPPVIESDSVVSVDGTATNPSNRQN